MNMNTYKYWQGAFHGICNGVPSLSFVSLYMCIAVGLTLNRTNCGRE